MLTGAIDDVGAPIRASSGKSYRLGLEIDASVQLHEQITIKPTLAFSQNRNKDFFATINGDLQNLGDTPLSFSPNVIIGNALIYQPTENLQFSFLSKYVGEQFLSNFNSKVSTLDVLESYFTNDFNIVYEITPNRIFKSIVFTGLINNIFDVEYVDRGYYYTYDDTWSNPSVTTTIDGSGYYPQATRNFLIGVTLRF